MGNLHYCGWWLTMLWIIYVSRDASAAAKQNLLFRVVCRICEYFGIESALYTVQAPYGESMMISLDKVVIEELTPDAMHELTMAMCEYVGFLTVAHNHVMYFIQDL